MTDLARATILLAGAAGLAFLGVTLCLGALHGFEIAAEMVRR